MSSDFILRILTLKSELWNSDFKVSMCSLPVRPSTVILLVSMLKAVMLCAATMNTFKICWPSGTEFDLKNSSRVLMIDPSLRREK